MRVLTLTKDELILLSLIQGKPYNTFSAMTLMNISDKPIEAMTKEDYVKIVGGFIKNKLAGFDDQKQLRPTNETLLLFDTINAPKKTFILQNELIPGSGTTYYSEKNELGVLITLSPDQAFAVINYPFNRDILGNWLDQEVIGDLETEKVAYEPIHYELSTMEYTDFMLMVAYNNHKLSLKENNPQTFTADDLRSDDFLATFEAMVPLGLTMDSISQLSEGSQWKESIGVLTEKGLINPKGDSWSLNPLLANAYDTRSFRSILHFSEFNTYKRAKSLYVSNNGYLIVEPILYAPSAFSITLLPLTTPPEVLMTALMTFSDIRLTETMRKDLESKLKALQ